MAVTAATMLVALAAPAAAHTELVESDPGDGATVDHPPNEVRLQFSDEVSNDFVDVRVSVDGADPRAAPATVAGDVLSADVTELATHPLAAQGAAWQVSYRVVSADGHPIEGSLGFSVVGPSTDAASSGVDTSASTTSALAQGGEPAVGRSTTVTWPVVLAGAVAIAVLVMLLAGIARLRRERGA